MNKSLLAVMAIMPTLLVGCKSEESIKGIALEPSELGMTVSESGYFDICPKPSSAKLNPDNVEVLAHGEFTFTYYSAGLKPGSLKYSVVAPTDTTPGTYPFKITYGNVSAGLTIIIKSN